MANRLSEEEIEARLRAKYEAAYPRWREQQLRQMERAKARRRADEAEVREADRIAKDFATRSHNPLWRFESVSGKLKATSSIPHISILGQDAEHTMRSGKRPVAWSEDVPETYMRITPEAIILGDHRQGKGLNYATRAVEFAKKAGRWTGELPLVARASPLALAKASQAPSSMLRGKNTDPNAATIQTAWDAAGRRATVSMTYLRATGFSYMAVWSETHKLLAQAVDFLEDSGYQAGREYEKITLDHTVEQIPSQAAPMWLSQAKMALQLSTKRLLG